MLLQLRLTWVRISLSAISFKPLQLRRLLLLILLLNLCQFLLLILRPCSSFQHRHSGSSTAKQQQQPQQQRVRIVILILPSDTLILFGDVLYCICFDHPNRETAMLLSRYDASAYPNCQCSYLFNTHGQGNCNGQGSRSYTSDRSTLISLPSCTYNYICCMLQLRLFL